MSLYYNDGRITQLMETTNANLFYFGCKTAYCTVDSTETPSFHHLKKKLTKRTIDLKAMVSQVLLTGAIPWLPWLTSTLMLGRKNVQLSYNFCFNDL